MLEIERRKQFDWFLGKAQILATVATVCSGASLKANPEEWSVAAGLLLWMQRNAWWIVVSSPIVLGVLQWIRRELGNPWAWETTQKLLEEFRSHVFEANGEDASDRHRVTLFRYYRWRPLWTDLSRRKCSRQLVAVARSGHLRRNNIERFRVPDIGEDCEGIAGQAFRRSGWIIVPPANAELPEITPTSSKEDIQRYSRETFVDTDYVNDRVRSKKGLSLSYAAITVRHKGKPWGVLVIDSRSHNAIPRDKLNSYRAYASVLTPLLERI